MVTNVYFLLTRYSSLKGKVSCVINEILKPQTHENYVITNYTMELTLFKVFSFIYDLFPVLSTAWAFCILLCSCC